MQYNYRMIISVDNLYNKVENNLGIMVYLPEPIHKATFQVVKKSFSFKSETIDINE